MGPAAGDALVVGVRRTDDGNFRGLLILLPDFAILLPDFAPVKERKPTTSSNDSSKAAAGAGQNDRLYFGCSTERTDLHVES
jgi:hypothetical protein